MSRPIEGAIRRFVEGPGSRRGAKDDTPAALLARIAELESSQAELQREKAAADAANEAKSRFLASVSHEIRSPLNSIYGYAQLLERGAARDVKHAAKVIRRSSEHLDNLVEGLLDLSQVESGVLRLNRDTIRFPELLRQMVDMFEPQARSKGLEFRFDRPESLPEFVRGDQKRLRQVLINLIANAIKFTDSGHVTFKVAYRNDLAVFEVEDSGIGIAADELDRIFEPFERGSEAAGGRLGVGLGLAITHALVQIMGGEIRVESRPGEGTRFTVRLMLSQPLSPPADVTPSAVVTGYAGPRRRILVVDDDQAQSRMLQNLLEPLGFDISSARDGDQAIALAADIDPDLVFLDISMPGKSGWETADVLRKLHGGALRIVILSADAQDFRLGGDGDAVNDMFVMKPFQFSMLLDVISAQLGLEWIGQEDDGQGNSHRPSDAALDTKARPHLAEIERLARMGDVRGIEAQLDVIAALYTEGERLVADMRQSLASFDLKAVTAVAKKAMTDVG